MRVIPLTVTAVAAALLLTACNGGGNNGSGSKNSSACQIGGVSLQVGAASVAPAAGDTGEVPVSITNQSKTCTLEDFPVVTLSGKGASGKLSAQKGAKAQTLKLAKGDAATFTISYVRGKDGDATSLAATDMKISLPGGGSAQTFPWKYGPIAGQGAQTRPNASVSAFQQAGD
ncbi:DUF4232 domain-containing protein [Streptomyces misionensis]|uniref:DUF4232 domain-containing protein n=1 Tax=Streptomyces misionensis TaxID=67331 RepID=A0A5C6JVB6_9ACTN|nr:DUF4232 domain-containing protein [Streptomyces misionensis]TWV52004.1 DUF4232 domain-containing protein [Streptomyces misionensis]